MASYLDQIIADERAAEETQYAQELARAQGRSGAGGFIAAEVSPFGEVLAPAVDSSYRTQEQLFEEAKLESAARRYKGQQMYASLIKNGATPAEAIRLAGSDLFANNPAGMVNAVVRSQPRPSPIQRAVPGRLPPSVKAEEANIVKRMGDVRTQLKGKNLKGYEVPLTPEERAPLEAKLTELENERVRLLSDPRYNPNVDQVGYARIRGAMESEPIPRPAIMAAEQAPVVTEQLPSGGVRIGRPTSQSKSGDAKELTVDVAKEFLRLADGDKEKARKLAKDAGYVL